MIADYDREGSWLIFWVCDREWSWLTKKVIEPSIYLIDILDKEAQEIKQELGNTIKAWVVNVNAEQEKLLNTATERANYLLEASSQFKTVEVKTHQNRQTKYCCNVV